MAGSSDYGKKYRKFCFEVWQESTDYVTDFVLFAIKCQPIFAYIKHDKDKNEETGELKKIHYQGCLAYGYPLTCSAVANKLGVPDNFVQPCKSWKGSLRYLMHLDNFEKYQYDRSEVITNIPDFNMLVGLLNEGSIMASVFDMLEGGSTPFEIVKSCTYDSKVYSVIRRNWTIIFAYWKSREKSRKSVLVDMDAVNYIFERNKSNETL